MSTPAIPIDPDIVAFQGEEQPTGTSAFAQDDSAIADESEDEDDGSLAIASAIPRRFSKRQSQGATGMEVRRLSNATSRARRESASVRRPSNAANEGAGRYRSPSVSTQQDGAPPRQRKYSSGMDSLRPSNVFHLDNPVLSSNPSPAPSVPAGGAPTPSHSPFDDSAGASSATASTTTQRRPSHSAAQENGVVVHKLDRVDTKGTTGGGSFHMPTLGEAQEFDVDQQATFEVQDDLSEAGRDTGTLAQLRSKIILAIICTAQLLDNISMTSVNMALPAITKELDITEADSAWIISAYTLTFGGFLLLAGVLSDRYGKKLMFIGGLAQLSIWVAVCGGAQTAIQLDIFRAMQGLGAAATVPSAVGILTNYFQGRERNLCLTIFGAAGALGFVVGLIYGGVLTDVLNWRWVFWLTSPVGFSTAVAAWFVLPNPKPHKNERRKSLDFIGAAIATSGLILLTFVLSSGDSYGWSTPFVIACLVIAVVLLAAFPVVEHFVKDPLLPNSLWRKPGFAATWTGGFFMYCWWQTLVLYNTYISQRILHLSALRTSLQFIPMGVFGAITSYLVGIGVNYVQIKHLLLIGLGISFVSVIPVAVMNVEHGFWASVFPSCILGVIGISISYNATSVQVMASVPPEAKSLAGGLINTAFQIGAGFGVAIAAAVVSGVESKVHSGTEEEILLQSYKAGIWTTGGFCGAAFLLTLFFVKGGIVEVGPVH